VTAWWFSPGTPVSNTCLLWTKKLVPMRFCLDRFHCIFSQSMFILLNCFVYRCVHFVELFCVQMCSKQFNKTNTSVNKTIQQNEHLWKKQFNNMNTSVHKEIQQNEHLCKQNNFVLCTDVFILLNCFVYRYVHFVELFCLQRCSFCWIVLFSEVFILLNCFVYRGVHVV
jgi:hypothetical protein